MYAWIAMRSALEKQGRTFKDGVCTWTDEKGKIHNQDASETVEAYARGHEVDYPELRYKDIIMMNPAAFSWIKDREQAGIGRKHLGTFTERDVEREGTGRDDRDAGTHRVLPELHHGALAVLLLDLRERDVEHLVPVHRSLLSSPPGTRPAGRERARSEDAIPCL